MGGGRIFLKPSAPLSLMKTYRMSLISAGSISLDSTFKVWVLALHIKGGEKCFKIYKTLQYFRLHLLICLMYQKRDKSIKEWHVASVIFISISKSVSWWPRINRHDKLNSIVLLKRRTRGNSWKNEDFYRRRYTNSFRRYIDRWDIVTNTE